MEILIQEVVGLQVLDVSGVEQASKELMGNLEDELLALKRGLLAYDIETRNKSVGHTSNREENVRTSVLYEPRKSEVAFMVTHEIVRQAVYFCQERKERLEKRPIERIKEFTRRISARCFS